MRGFIVGCLLLTAALAGCIGERDLTGDPTVDLLGLFAGEPLWADPQNAPHPGWGWPTLSHGANATALPEFWGPITGVDLPASITGVKHAAGSPEGVTRGGGIALFGSLAFVPGSGGGKSAVVDVSDPLTPKLLGEVTPEAGHRGAAIIAYPDGRLVAVVSTGPGFDVVNMTDPRAPEILGSVSPTERGHKVGVVPGTPIVYNAGSSGGNHLESMATGITSIYDLTDPSDPVLVQEFQNGYACHHIYFWSDGSKHRALCAGIEVTQIWDIEDPLDPQVIVTVPVHHGIAGTPSASVPLMAFSHYAGLSMDGTILIVGDEMGGGGVPPGCGAYAATPLGDLSTPLGALWFYDVSNERDPQLRGWFSPGQHFTTHQASTSCTAHHGRLIPVEDRDLLAMAFYGAGVALIDFTDPTAPQMVDQWNPGTNTWEVWYNNGYLFTGDLARGLDVLAFE